MVRNSVAATAVRMSSAVDTTVSSRPSRWKSGGRKFPREAAAVIMSTWPPSPAPAPAGPRLSAGASVAKSSGRHDPVPCASAPGARRAPSVFRRRSGASATRTPFASKASMTRRTVSSSAGLATASESNALLLVPGERDRPRRAATMSAGMRATSSVETERSSGSSVGMRNCSASASKSCSSVITPSSTRFLPSHPPCVSWRRSARVIWSWSA